MIRFAKERKLTNPGAGASEAFRRTSARADRV